MAPLAVALNLLMLIIGFGVAKLGRLERRQSVTVAIETAMQNATLAIVIATTVLHEDALVVPASIYGVLMYMGGLAFAFIARVSRSPIREFAPSDPVRGKPRPSGRGRIARTA